MAENLIGNKLKMKLIAVYVRHFIMNMRINWGS